MLSYKCKDEIIQNSQVRDLHVEISLFPRVPNLKLILIFIKMLQLFVHACF